MIVSAGARISVLSDNISSNLTPALKQVMDAFDTEQVNDYINYFKELNDYTSEQTLLLGQLQQRQALYNKELEQLKSQREIMIATHGYQEALHYIPLALDDATYSSKIFDETTRALVDSIRIQREEIKKLDQANQAFSLSEQSNSLEMMQIQLSAMDHRGRMTREEKQRMQELDRLNLQLRIGEQQNSIQIEQIRQGGLTAEEERLDRIKTGYDEQIRVTEDAYNRELKALDLNIEGKGLLLSEYQTAINTVNTNINNAQKTFWEEYHKIETNNQLTDTFKAKFFADQKLKIIIDSQKNILKAQMATTIGQLPTATPMQQLIPKGFLSQVFKILGFGTDIDAYLKQFYGITHLQTGIDYVPRTKPYILHKGEAVITAGQNKNVRNPVQVKVDPITVYANITDNTDVQTLVRKLELAIQSGLVEGITTSYG
jgi:hypothetical protein